MKKTLLISGLLLMPWLASADLADGCFGSGYGMMGGYYGGGLGFLGVIFNLLIWVAIIAGIVYLVKILFPHKSKSEREKGALDILNERYAKGEINKEEFAEKKKDLQ